MAVRQSASPTGECITPYIHFYQKLKFQESNADKILVARAKQMQMLLNYLESSRSKDRCVTNLLLKQNLDDYGEAIDDRDGINNYAQYINNVCSKSLKPALGPDKWKSQLNIHNFIPTIEYLHLNIKSAEEEKFDNDALRRFMENLRSNRNETEPIRESTFKENVLFENDIKNMVSRNTISLHQTKKPALPNTSSFCPARSVFSNYPTQDHREPSKTDTVFKEKNSFNGFKSARTEFIQLQKKYGCHNRNVYQHKDTSGVKKSLGGRLRSLNGKFVPPIKSNSSDNQELGDPVIEDEHLKNLDPKMIELIRNEIMDNGNPLTWDDISGLEFAKKTIQEIVVWPLLRPDIFTGLRRPPKGILLFGPPGTGKTLIGKCIASQSSSTFFSISASSLTSKWIGESEKLVRTLFSVARCHQPAVIFIDEIDSLLSQRSETEHESSRRIKTEFLVQLDGATTHEEDMILVIGATNRPQELDEAARRRLVKRLYIPLPEFDARKQIVQRLMSTEKNELSERDIDEIASLTDGYSGADMKNLCQEASLGPIRSIDFHLISSIESQQVRPVTVDDFKTALNVVRSSISSSDLNQYLEWDKIYGSRGT